MSILNSLPWSEQQKIAAWTACQPLQQLPPAGYRLDAYGNIIAWAQYGSLTQYGWEIDHAHPTALGGPDSLSNLRALHWRANRSLGGMIGNALKR